MVFSSLGSDRRLDFFRIRIGYQTGYFRSGLVRSWTDRPGPVYRSRPESGATPDNIKKPMKGRIFQSRSYRHQEMPIIPKNET